MSTWTHVAGCIRFDSIRELAMLQKAFEHPKEFMGKTFSYEDEQERWDECDVPSGSEGSLEYSVWENPSEHAMAAYSVSIFGDLRDYDDVGEIKKYLKRICDGRMVRQGVVHISVESGESVTVMYDRDAKEWIEMTNKGE